MTRYFINRNAQPNGYHEVHAEGCQFLPSAENMIYLGEFSSRFGALQAAKTQFAQVSGCHFCTQLTEPIATLPVKKPERHWILRPKLLKWEAIGTIVAIITLGYAIYYNQQTDDRRIRETLPIIKITSKHVQDEFVSLRLQNVGGGPARIDSIVAEVSHPSFKSPKTIEFLDRIALRRLMRELVETGHEAFIDHYIQVNDGKVNILEVNGEIDLIEVRFKLTENATNLEKIQARSTGFHFLNLFEIISVECKSNQGDPCEIVYAKL